MRTKNVDYTDYLALEKILNAQNLESLEQSGESSHEEMLFIITHQTYELWFKQMLWEAESIIKIFQKESVSDQDLSLCVHRLKRINEIWRVLIDQIKVLETMTPLEFLDFRKYLYPASGFQSAQFRTVENKLGLDPKTRISHGGCPYHQFLNKNLQEDVIKTEKEPNLLSSVENWLERTPYLKTENYNFWKVYQEAVTTMFQQEESFVNKNSSLSEAEKEQALKDLKKTEENFKNFMDPELFKENKNKMGWRLSFEALHAALFIQLYRHELKLQSANRLIEELIDLDENMTQWRNRHAQMALRMLGEKVGTGGSAGADYLKNSADTHKIFTDFFKLTTYMIEAKSLKDLPTL